MSFRTAEVKEAAGILFVRNKTPEKSTKPPNYKKSGSLVKRRHDIQQNAEPKTKQ